MNLTKLCSRQHSDIFWNEAADILYGHSDTLVSWNEAIVILKGISEILILWNKAVAILQGVSKKTNSVKWSICHITRGLRNVNCVKWSNGSSTDLNFWKYSLDFQNTHCLFVITHHHCPRLCTIPTIIIWDHVMPFFYSLKAAFLSFICQHRFMVFYDNLYNA